MFDSTEDPPERWWVLEPDSHTLNLPPSEDHRWVCQTCGGTLNTKLNTGRTICLPIYRGQPICGTCVSRIIDDHPMTPEYLEWLDTGDHRWWSPWLCSCTGCANAITVEPVS